jgi:hypothetical protein
MNTDLSPAEVAEIDKLIRLRHQQVQQEGQEIICREEKERQILLRTDHTKGPWPERLEHGSTEFGDYVYVREGDKAHEVSAGHPFLIEVARRDGMIRYAWTGGLTFDLSQYWNKYDPSWQFIVDRAAGVPPSDWDRAIQQAIKDLFRTNMPVGPYTKAYLEAFCVSPADPKRRKEDQEQALAALIGGQVKWLADLLDEAEFDDPTTRAREYLAPLWRKIVKQHCGRWRFSSGEALSAWLRRHDPTKSTPKMSFAHGRSKHYDEG